MIQPFLAARHGFLLNGADSPESPEETPEIEDGFLDTEDGLLETEGGLLETEDDESLFETENDEESLADEGEGFLEEEGDGLLTSDDAPAREEWAEGYDDCVDEKADFLDNVDDFGGGLGQCWCWVAALWTEGVDPVRLVFDVPSDCTESLLIDFEESCFCGICGAGTPSEVEGADGPLWKFEEGWVLGNMADWDPRRNCGMG
jgi:hypothetical protein